MILGGAALQQPALSGLEWAAINLALTSTLVIPNHSQPVKPARVSEESAFGTLPNGRSWRGHTRTGKIRQLFT
jgi:hypothetical protein